MIILSSVFPFYLFIYLFKHYFTSFNHLRIYVIFYYLFFLFRLLSHIIILFNVIQIQVNIIYPRLYYQN